MNNMWKHQKHNNSVSLLRNISWKLNIRVMMMVWRCWWVSVLQRWSGDWCVSVPRCSPQLHPPSLPSSQHATLPLSLLLSSILPLLYVLQCSAEQSQAVPMGDLLLIITQVSLPLSLSHSRKWWLRLLALHVQQSQSFWLTFFCFLMICVECF